MSQIDQTVPIEFKICVMGGKLVGKTHLSHQLSAQALPDEYVSTTQVARLSKINESNNIKYSYYDFPSFSPSLSKEVTYFSDANLIILLFKDSTSFTELFQFFQRLSGITAANTTENRYIWQDIKHLYIIYNNYEETTAVQTDQIFKILCEQVRTFNQVAEISNLLWAKQDKSANQIKLNIQKIQFTKISDIIDMKPQQNGSLDLIGQQEDELPIEKYKVEQLEKIQIQPIIADLKENFSLQQQSQFNDQTKSNVEQIINHPLKNVQDPQQKQQQFKSQRISKKNESQIYHSEHAEDQNIKQDYKIQDEKIQNNINQEQLQIQLENQRPNEQRANEIQKPLSDEQIVDLKQKQHNKDLGNKQNITQDIKNSFRVQKQQSRKPENNYLAPKTNKKKSQQSKGIQTKSCSCEIM